MALLRSLLIPITCLIIAYLSLVCFQMSGMADDPGLGWHLATGKWAVNNNFLPPNHDPFLANSEPRKWISDQWICDIILYLTQNYLGWETLYALVTSIFIIVFTVTCFYTCSYRKISPAFASIAYLFGLKLASVHFIVRPVIFSFALFAVVFLFLIKIHSRQRVTIWEWIFCPLIFLLWANSHPSFILGLAMIVLMAVSLIIEKFFTKDLECRKELIPQLLILTLACLFISFLNPYGSELHRSILYLSNSTYFLNLNEEWKSLSLQTAEGQCFTFISSVIIMGLFIYGRQNLKYRTFEAICCLIFAFLSLRSVRFLPYFAICLIPLLAATIEVFWTSKVRKVFSVNLVRSYQMSVLISCLLSLTITVNAIQNQKIFGYQDKFGLSAEKFPEKALQEIKSLEGLPKTILSTPNWGGFIIWQGKGTIKPVIDDRNTLLGEEFYRRFFKAKNRPKDFINLAHELNATFILLPMEDELIKDLIRARQVKVIFQDNHAILFQLVKSAQIDSK